MRETGLQLPIVLCRMRRRVNPAAALAALLLFPAPRLTAQSVSPPIAEYTQRARSSFRLTNGTLFPLNVVLEIRGFRVTEQGEVIDVPLDTSRVHVKLSTMSFRIPPRGNYTVFYEATADSLPTWFNILSALSGARTDEGLNVRILLPHVVYLNQKRPLRRDEVVIRSFAYDEESHRVRVELENTGPSLGRALKVTASDGHAESAPAGGFPLFPFSHRWVEAGWEPATPPTRLSVRFAKFTLDTTLEATRAPAADTLRSASTAQSAAAEPTGSSRP